MTRNFLPTGGIEPKSPMLNNNATQSSNKRFELFEISDLETIAKIPVSSLLGFY